MDCRVRALLAGIATIAVWQWAAWAGAQAGPGVEWMYYAGANEFKMAYSPDGKVMAVGESGVV